MKMDDGLSEIPKQKREENNGRTERVKESPIFLEWLEKRREQEADRQIAAREEKPTGPVRWKQTLRELVGIVALAVLFAIGAAHYDQIKSALSGLFRGAINAGLVDTATVQQVRRSQSRRYLYLNDGTVWGFFQDPKARFFVLPGDQVRFKFWDVQTHTSPGGFDGEICFVENATRPQAPTVMLRMAGDPKRDSCPAR